MLTADPCLLLLRIEKKKQLAVTTHTIAFRLIANVYFMRKTNILQKEKQTKQGYTTSVRLRSQEDG